MGTYGNLFKNRGLLMFLLAQFLSAFNDNLYKTVFLLLLLSKVTLAGYLSLVSALLILPGIVFSGYAGYFADRFSKRHVLLFTKYAEIILMMFATLFFLIGDDRLIFLICLMLAVHAAFFNTTKYSIVPELIPKSELSRVNGLLEMSSVLAMVMGAAIGGLLIYLLSDKLYIVGLMMLAVAVTGYVVMRQIARVPASNPDKRFSRNPLSEIFEGFERIRSYPLLFVIAFAISYFWGLGMAVQLNILLFSKQLWQATQFDTVGALGTSLLNVALGIGIGLGGLFSGKISGDKIETGIIPIGAIGIMIMFSAIASGPTSGILIHLLFVGAGLFAGLFIVPLNAMLQHLPSTDEKGRIVATNSFFNGIAMLVGAASIWIFHDLFHWDPLEIFRVIAMGTLFIGLVILYYLPDGFFYFILWFLTHTIYRVKTLGAENVPEQGPALIVCNHVTYIDGLILTAALSRKISFMVLKSFYDNTVLHWFLQKARAIPVLPGNKMQVGPAITHTREMLLQGHVVCIFAEGALSRTGHLLPFRRGLERIVEGYDIPIIPAHLGKLWDSWFAPGDKKVRSRLPHRLSVPITVSFGKPLKANAKAWQVRQAVQEVIYDAQKEADYYHDTLPVHTLKVLRYKYTRKIIADTQGRYINAINLISRILLLSRYLRKRTHNKEVVGLLLSPSVDNLLVTTALAAAGCITLNIPYTRQVIVYDALVKANGVQLVITSRAFIKRLNFLPQHEMIFIEDYLDYPWWIQSAAALLAVCLPASICVPLFGRSSQAADPVAIVYAKSANSPGVLLSHRNILSNCAGLEQIIPFSKRSRFLAVLPTYSALGYTCSLWFPLLTGMMIVAQDDPNQFSRLSVLLRQYKVTMIVNTPNGYQKMIEHLSPEDFPSLKHAMIGAGKVNTPLWYHFHEKFGIDLLEGYGRTELGPIVSVNTPNFDENGHLQTGNKAGSVGQPLPGVAIRIVRPHSTTLCEVMEKGELWVKSPGLMLGYWNLHQPITELNNEGWYNTGQIACIDNDGFLMF